MLPPPVPHNEIERLAALHGYGILDTPPEPCFDELAAAAAHVCQTPLAIVSLVAEGRQWFKARLGVGLTETCRDASFCAHAVASGEVLVVPDAAADPRFADNPYVVGPPHIRFYAGAPLIDREGFALGALCVLDVRPRELSPAQLDVLCGLSRQVMSNLTLRRHAADASRYAEQCRLAEARLRHESMHDALTGLPNRVLLLDRLRRRVESAATEPGQFAVLFLDLDRFKTVNDSLGHAAGDRLLVGIADGLRGQMAQFERESSARRPGGGSRVTVARMGGDEFCVLLESGDDPIAAAGEVVEVADRVRAAAAAPVRFEGRDLVCGASIGVALGPGAYRRAEDLIRDADSAMYRAKAAGKNRVVAADPSLHRAAMNAIDLECDLRAVLAGGPRCGGATSGGEAADGLVVHYQPIVAASAGHRVLGFEALVRWRHPVRGLISPAEVIPLAEETGLIVPLGDFVLRTALRQLRRWRDDIDPLLTMSVNVSGRQLDEADYAATVDDALAEAGVTPSALTLEVTETAVADRAGEVLARLRSAGVRAVMDDFGTGYSSMSALRRLPLDGIKLDRSFTQQSPDADGRVRDEAMIRAAVVLADGLGLSLVAEGIESAEQGDWIAGLGCRRLQGYHFGRPMPAGQAGDYLAARRPTLSIAA